LNHRINNPGFMYINTKNGADGKQMTCFTKNPELSVIVPVLNEVGVIQALLSNLAVQQDVNMEVIISDGGSKDGTLEKALEMTRDYSFPVRFVRVNKGRGRQMNAGAVTGRGEFFLFLHADSLFDDRHALRKALDNLAVVIKTLGCKRVAGRFALRFHGEAGISVRSFYYNECKAQLNRGQCIHGDQGFLLHRSFFAEAGFFKETLPFFEDTCLAEAVRVLGEWILLPAEIFTSIRRFRTEGFAGRQTLNAVMMTLAAIGREDFLLEMPHIYASQDFSRRLRIFPFLHKIRKLVNALPWWGQLSFWYAAGTYVLANAWQLAFMLDVRRNFRRGLPAGKGAIPSLERFDRYYCRLVDHPPGRMAAAVLVRILFQLVCIYGCIRKKAGQKDWDELI
jgi:rSAM/selenodomain-associated transferase 2